MSDKTFKDYVADKVFKSDNLVRILAQPNDAGIQGIIGSYGRVVCAEGEYTYRVETPYGQYLFDNDKLEIFKFNTFEKVLVRDLDNEEWMPSFFSHYDNDNDQFIEMTGGYKYKQCIPYEGNEALAFTTDLPSVFITRHHTSRYLKKIASFPEEEQPPFKWGDRVLVWNECEECQHNAIFIDMASDGTYNCVPEGAHRTFHFWHCKKA